VTIEKLDLNLFKVFQAVLRHRSTTGAARELCVTASAISHALSRLRQALGDGLFISGETGVEPPPERGNWRRVFGMVWSASVSR
jgi:DNA-binding transcriptional LysR family regulator